jgi:hypothetical protein
MAGGPIAISLADWQAWTTIVKDAVTAAGVVVGGVWAYYRFGKDRIYRPRIEAGVHLRWVEADGCPVAHLRISVRNAGNSVVYLGEEKCYFRLQLPADTTRPDRNEAERVQWTDLEGDYLVLREHDWIEPNETVVEDHALRVPADSAPPLTEVRLRLLVARSKRKLDKYHAQRRQVAGVTDWSTIAIIIHPPPSTEAGDLSDTKRNP